MSIINTQVQPFKAQAFHNGKFVEVTEASHGKAIGQW
jgi:NADH-dependent peroxiredoxin subunit C